MSAPTDSTPSEPGEPGGHPGAAPSAMATGCGLSDPRHRRGRLGTACGLAGWVAAQCLQERGEAGVAGVVSCLAQADGENVAGGLMAVALKRVPSGTRGREQVGGAQRRRTMAGPVAVGRVRSGRHRGALRRACAGRIMRRVPAQPRFRPVLGHR
jgi:hypothetical protein